MSKARELSKLLSGTLKVGALQAPAGTTAQRPSGQVGQIRYNSETGKNETYDSGGWGAIATPPLITTVSPSTYNGEAGTQFTINGSFFDVGASVKFIDNAGVEYTASVVTRNNAGQLLATTPQDFTVAQEPLKVKVLNPSGLNYTLDAAIDCGGSPSWVTAAGSLGTVIEDTTISNITLQATDLDAGSTITFAIQSGSLPNGLVLSSNGVISGTPNVNDAYSSGVTHSFDVTALDNAGNAVSRSFSILRKWRDGSSALQAASSAAAIKSMTNTTTDGVYWIKPDAYTGSAFQVYCKMSIDSNGWMRILYHTPGDYFDTTLGANGQDLFRSSMASIVPGGNKEVQNARKWNAWTEMMCWWHDDIAIKFSPSSGSFATTYANTIYSYINEGKVNGTDVPAGATIGNSAYGLEAVSLNVSKVAGPRAFTNGVKTMNFNRQGAIWWDSLGLGLGSEFYITNDGSFGNPATSHIALYIK